MTLEKIIVELTLECIYNPGLSIPSHSLCKHLYLLYRRKLCKKLGIGILKDNSALEYLDIGRVFHQKEIAKKEMHIYF